MKPRSLQKQRTQAPQAESNKLDLRNEIQEQYGKRAVPWFPWVFATLDLSPASRVCELGCGTGTLWQENQARIPSGWEVVLTDRDLDMVTSARANLAAIDRDIRFAEVDSQEIPFPAECFDTILAVGLLDLVPDLEKTLGEIWRVLRPSGMFIATAGGKGHLKELEELLQPFLPDEKAEIIGGSEERFGLENGERLLAPFFEEIVRHDYRDRMVFTQLQPVLDYVLSEQEVYWSMPLQTLGNLTLKIKDNLARNGSMEVTIRKGMFIARKKMVV